MSRFPTNVDAAVSALQPLFVRNPRKVSPRVLFVISGALLANLTRGQAPTGRCCETVAIDAINERKWPNCRILSNLTPHDGGCAEPAGRSDEQAVWSDGIPTAAPATSVTESTLAQAKYFSSADQPAKAFKRVEHQRDAVHHEYRQCQDVFGARVQHGVGSE